MEFPKDGEGRKGKEEGGSSRSSSQYGDGKNQEVSNMMKMWGILIFGVIGATASTYAVGQIRRTFNWFTTQLSRAPSSYTSWKGSTNSSGHPNFRDDAWHRFNRRVQEELEEEMERVERIRRMQSVFNRERDKYRRTYESWRENNGPGEFHQQFQREDWYWKTDTSYQDQRRANSWAAPKQSGSYAMSHHYSILGLDRFRATPYTEAEIKDAFRTKAKEYHPDQNQVNKEAAEAKFKEVMVSYEAIKLERKNGKC